MKAKSTARTPRQVCKFPLEETDWRVLLKSIHQRKCILLLGPGVAVDPANPNGNALQVQLAQQLSTELNNKGKGEQVLATDDFPHVAQIYESEMPKRRIGLELATEDFYGSYRDKTTQLHLDLAALPFKLCVTTTPDRFLLNAFKQIPHKKPIYEFYHFQPDPTRPPRPPSDLPPLTDAHKHPLIYDLYGSLDQTESLVLTEDDLLDLLVSVTRRTPGLHPYVTAQFGDPTVSFLFLGFGFRHWYLRILLHVLKASGHESPSLALEDSGFFIVGDHQRTALFFQRHHAIEFREFPADFASQLRRRFEQQTAQTESSNAKFAELPADAPTVFLCHEVRDKPKAEELAEKLQQCGIRIWLDIQNLRGGDNWEKLIPHVLKKQTDYVIILQSPRMLDKPESYFKKEIYYALERQTKFGDFRFTIPALLEQHSKLPLPDLEELHCVDLTLADGLRNLTNTIHEDWRRRGAMKPAA